MKYGESLESMASSFFISRIDRHSSRGRMVWIISQLVLLFLISVVSQPHNHQEPLPLTLPAAVPHEEAHEHQPAHESVPSEMINNEGEPHPATPKPERRRLETWGDTTEKKGNFSGLADEPLILHTDPIPGAELFTLTADKDKACPG